MKSAERYYLFKESEIQLVQSMIGELQEELSEMFARKKWTFDENGDCKIQMDFDFVSSKSSNELFSFVKTGLN